MTRHAFISRARASLANVRQGTGGPLTGPDRVAIHEMSPRELREALQAAGAWTGFREKFRIIEFDDGEVWDGGGPLDFLEERD